MTCKEKKCPPLAMQIRTLDSSFDAFCEKVKRDEATCNEWPCYFCHRDKKGSATDIALAGYIETQLMQFKDTRESGRQRIHREEYEEFVTGKSSTSINLSNCLATGQKKCPNGRGNPECYLSCAAFQVKVGKGKISPEVLKQLGIDRGQVISPHEAAAKHWVLLSLLNLSPALFGSPVRMIDVWAGEICIYTEHMDFYKGRIKVKRTEKYDHYTGSVLMLPKLLRKEKWNSYSHMKEYFSAYDLHNCENCWEAKKCKKDSGKEKCMIMNKHSGRSCWVTPWMCAKNKNERLPWMWRMNCLMCEFYKKTQRMLSFRRVFF